MEEEESYILNEVVTKWEYKRRTRDAIDVPELFKKCSEIVQEMFQSFRNCFRK